MFARVPPGPIIDDISQVSSAEIGQETAAHVKGAKVVCANYRAIVHDFPHFFGASADPADKFAGCKSCEAIGKPCPAAINQWLVRNAAFVSLPQSRGNGVNTRIDLDGVTRVAYRPPAYGRALIVPVDGHYAAGSAKFLDLKGAGVQLGETPSHEAYKNGLEYLGFAIADFLYGWLIDTLFARSYPGYHIVPVYAVLDLGFDIVGGWHGTSPAGMHVRRAHARPIPSESLPKAGSELEKLDLHIELLLRSFGLSTTGSGTSFRLANLDIAGDDTLTYKSMPVAPLIEPERVMVTRIAEAIRASGGDCLEITNVQMTSGGSWSQKAAQIYDFGQVRAERWFPNPIANAVRNTPLNVGRVMSPADVTFVQPHPAIAVDADLGNRRSVDALGFHAATSFRQDGPFRQIDVETMLRIARLKIMRRHFDWAIRGTPMRHQRAANSAVCANLTAQRLHSTW
ncbi:hypothetical protein QE385_004010 [Sphingomonas sp. SORGH_AS 950]|uniref:hypothetical protein n=1 Tax=Sphingomonas sp. SORGH_AS_0950 TaxID=3041792 RepID=UPI00277EE95C|nr:hypothetical protein [Sphingomonas sp. SORGH_AS_0950]MDQ1159613.1 hypothetical protein [Sphingomonas sp. SORGH_AS_0950]